MLRGVVVEVEFSTLQSEVSQGFSGHKVAFDIASAELTSFTHYHILFPAEFFLEAILLILFIGVESFADFNSFISVPIFPNQGCFGIPCVCHVELVIIDNGHKGTRAYIASLRESSVEGSLGDLEPFILNSLECLFNALSDGFI
jgi:hypothetical protein